MTVDCTAEMTCIYVCFMFHKARPPNLNMARRSPLFSSSISRSFRAHFYSQYLPFFATVFKPPSAAVLEVLLRGRRLVVSSQVCFSSSVPMLIWTATSCRIVSSVDDTCAGSSSLLLDPGNIESKSGVRIRTLYRSGMVRDTWETGVFLEDTQHVTAGPHRVDPEPLQETLHRFLSRR